MKKLAKLSGLSDSESDQKVLAEFYLRVGVFPSTTSALGPVVNELDGLLKSAGCC